MNELLSWFNAYQSQLTQLGIISLIILVGSLLVLPWLVARIPQDYFLHRRRQPLPWKDQHPVWRALLLIGKNLLGAILLCGGLLMLFLPGQGLLTIAMGMLLLDYPGKYWLERRVVAMPRVLSSLNWLRGKAGAPPLLVDGEE